MKLEKKVSIVTGAAQGIGRAIAHALGREGSVVIIGDIDIEGAERTADELRRLGAQALAIKTDVSKEAEVGEMVRKTLDQFGSVDILVNNAAFLAVKYKYFYETEPAEWDAEINVTFKGVLHCCRMVIPHMISQNSGRIVNITSGAAQSITSSRLSVYAGCKAAVAGFSRIIAFELTRYGILVNCVSPGSIRTETFEKMQPRMIDKSIASIPLRRAGEPADVANLVLFLASDDGKYITGQHWSVSGGAVVAL
ncbi:SDR family NAD(P)-dependent oxidoreductase [Chloroflexota bacterium]